jgi:hypothetical protein
MDRLAEKAENFYMQEPLTGITGTYKHAEENVTCVCLNASIPRDKKHISVIFKMKQNYTAV